MAWQINIDEDRELRFLMVGVCERGERGKKVENGYEN